MARFTRTTPAVVVTTGGCRRGVCGRRDTKRLSVGTRRPTTVGSDPTLCLVSTPT